MDGNDNITIGATAAGTPVTVAGGAGNDTFTVGQAGHPPRPPGCRDRRRRRRHRHPDRRRDAPPSGEPPHPPTGPYTYTVYDGGRRPPAGTGATAGSPAIAIHYSGLEGLTLLGSGDANTYNIWSTAQGTPVTRLSSLCYFSMLEFMPESVPSRRVFQVGMQ